MRIGKHIFGSALIGVVVSLAGIGGVGAQDQDVWPRLAATQRAILKERLRAIGEFRLNITTAVDCGCADLAHDIDDAARFAGADSTINELVGEADASGIRVFSDENGNNARKVADAISTATGGKLAPSVTAGDATMQGVTVLYIGRYRKN